MTKIGFFPLTGLFFPDGSGVSPKSRMVWYFLRRLLGMVTSGARARGYAGSRVSGPAYPRAHEPAHPSRRLPLLRRRSRPRTRGLLPRRLARGGAAWCGAGSGFRRRAFQAPAQRFHDVDDLAAALLLFTLLGDDGLAVRFRADAVQQALAVLVLELHRVPLLLAQLIDQHLGELELLLAHFAALFVDCV